MGNAEYMGTVETGESVCELVNSIFFPSLKLFTNTA